ncbi:MAG: tRNA isopentenyl-2-thiomethyl-A-37 hydroxylase MiaE [Phycisphaerae bacterium]
MAKELTVDDLPLRYRTPAVWARNVLEQPLALLSDHAHLEKKAAVNALALLNRWPEPSPPENWVQVLTAVARDEVEHLALITKLLARRGGELERMHRNNYAGDLRQFVRVGRGQEDLLDRLAVSALIEARSCERFALLAGATDDAELRRIYSGLWSSEAGHFRVFLNLAEQLPEKLNVAERWSEWLDFEAEVIQRQPAGPTMHSAVGADLT